MKRKELLYLYVDDYRGFHNQEFNFSSDIKIAIYKTKNEKTQEERRAICIKRMKDVLPEQFWGKSVNNVTLLIGENGAGKTSVMAIICKWIYALYEGKVPKGKGAMAFRYGSKIGVYNFLQKDPFDSDKNLDNTDLFYFTNESFKEFLINIKMVYFTNTMTELSFLTDIKKNELLADESLPKRLTDFMSQDAFGDCTLLDFNQHEFDRQMDILLQQNTDILASNRIQMNIDDTMKIEALNLDFLKSTIKPSHKAEYFIENLQLFWTVTISNYEFKANEKIKIYFLQDIFIGLTQRLLAWEQKEVRRQNRIIQRALGELLDFENKLKKDMKNNNFQHIIIVIHTFLIDFLRRIEELDTLHKDKKESPYGTLQKDINEYINVIIERNSILEYFEAAAGSANFELLLNKENLNMFKHFWEEYMKVKKYTYRIHFLCDSSSGEKNWMELLGMLSVINKDMENQKNTIWLFLDEPDNSFHPDWKRKLLKDLLKILNEIYEGKNIQLFMSTHSPIMLSDIPKSEVIYLEAKRDGCEEVIKCKQRNIAIHEETFGQNIYVLFKDAFFLDNGVIGTFAEDKIVKGIKNLISLKKELENKKNNNKIKQYVKDLIEYEKLIDLVAEQLFKNQLMTYFIQCQKLLENEEETDVVIAMIEKFSTAELEKIRQYIDSVDHKN